MSRRSTLALLSCLLLLGVPGAVMAQDEAAADPIWSAAVKKGGSDVVVSGDGFLLVGANKKPPTAKVWSSKDGLKWKKQKAGDAFKGASMIRATSFGEGVIVLGQDGRRLVSWHSPDGVDWVRKSVDKASKGLKIWPEALTAGPAGLLAVGSVIGQDIAGQRFYLSADGETWSPVVAPPVSDALFVSLAATPDEYLAVARPAFGTAGDLYWRSADGAVWETFAGPDGGWIYDVAVGEDGSFVAAGALAESEDVLRPAIWQASELGDWNLVYSYPSAKQTEDRLFRVEAAGPGFVAAGTISGCPDQANRSCPEAGIFATDDSGDWRRLGVADGVPGPLHDTEVVSLAANDSTTLMLAWHQGRPSEVWTLPAAE